MDEPHAHQLITYPVYLRPPITTHSVYVRPPIIHLAWTFPVTLIIRFQSGVHLRKHIFLDFAQHYDPEDRRGSSDASGTAYAVSRYVPIPGPWWRSRSGRDVHVATGTE